MRSRSELAIAALALAHQTFVGNTESVKIEEALESAGGYRSVLGIVKHVSGWSHVYRSYAFDSDPKHWAQADWPRGLRDTIEPTQDYLDEVRRWFEASYEAWTSSLNGLADEVFDEPRPCHWGGTMPTSSCWRLTTGSITPAS